MRRAASLSLKRLAADEGGAIAILFALMLMPMIGLSLTAIDYGRAIRLESRLQTAVDSAAAAAVHKLGQERAAIEATARQHLDNQLPSDLKGMPFSLAVGPQERFVEIAVETTIATSLIGLLGLDKFTVRATGQAYAARPAGPAKSFERTIEAAAQAGASPEAARALEELARRGGSGGGAPRGPTAAEQEEIRRAAEEADRLIRDALSRLGR